MSTNKTITINEQTYNDLIVLLVNAEIWIRRPEARPNSIRPSFEMMLNKLKEDSEYYKDVIILREEDDRRSEERTEVNDNTV